MQEIKRGVKSGFIGLVGGWHGSGKGGRLLDGLFTSPRPILKERVQ